MRSFQGRRVQPFASQAVASQVTRTTPEMGHLSVCTRLVPSLASLASYRLSILSKDSQDEPIDARLYHMPIPSQTDLPISYNIAPIQKVLTIRFNPETRARSLDALQWGLIPYWAKDSKTAYPTINARAETVDRVPSFELLRE